MSIGRLGWCEEKERVFVLREGLGVHLQMHRGRGVWGWCWGRGTLILM